MKQLLARKPIAELVPGDEGQGLRRELGVGDLVLLSIGAVIGAGIFSSIGTAAAGETLADGTIVRYGAGPALILSFVLLAVAVTVSCVTRLNVGLMSIAFAWLIGVYVAGMSLGDVMGGFPSQLFLTLAGVTLLFTVAQNNGTLERVAHQAVRACRGHRGAVPIMFFLLTAFLASIGPGNIASAALMSRST